MEATSFSNTSASVACFARWLYPLVRFGTSTWTRTLRRMARQTSQVSLLIQGLVSEQIQVLSSLIASPENSGLS